MDMSITRFRKLVGEIVQSSAKSPKAMDELKAFSDNFPKFYIKKGDANERPEILSELATDAKTIIDVGVNKGTPALYKAFSNLPFVLIDPAKDATRRVKNPPANHIFVNKAVGDKKDKLTLRENSGKSSLLAPKGEFRTWKILNEYEVEVDRLDSIIHDLGVQGPFGVKMDIQGFELPAIRGMTGIMDQIDFFICEVQVRRTSEGVYHFSDLIAEMLKHDFVFFNILNQWKPRARFYDVAFLRRGNPKFDMIG